MKMRISRVVGIAGFSLCVVPLGHGQVLNSSFEDRPNRDWFGAPAPIVRQGDRAVIAASPFGVFDGVNGTCSYLGLDAGTDEGVSVFQDGITLDVLACEGFALLTFYARLSVDCQAARVTLELPGNLPNTTTTYAIPFSDTWTKYELTVPVAADYVTNDAIISFSLCNGTQDVVGVAIDEVTLCATDAMVVTNLDAIDPVNCIGMCEDSTAATRVLAQSTGCGDNPVCPSDPCPWDLNDDGDVGPVDLNLLMQAWGPNPCHPADFNRDNDVGPPDLSALFENWGPCP